MADDNRERYINPYTDFGFKKSKAQQDCVFQKLFEQAEIARYSESERRQYEESKKIFWDNYSVLKTAEQKGILQGLEQGRAEGLQQGLQQGEQNKALSIARKLKSMGLSMTDIMQATGLTEETINNM